MPSTFPSLLPARVNARLLRAQAVSRSPFSFSEQVYDHGGRAWAIDLEMQIMDETDAAVFGAFLHGLDGMAGTFNFDLDPWVLGTTPGTKEFRITQSDPSWDGAFRNRFKFSFSAVEVVP